MSSETSEMKLIAYEVRQREYRKYDEAYRDLKYAMGLCRTRDAKRDLLDVPCRGTYLDVGCGRGEMIDYAKSIGFSAYFGTEVVNYLIDGHRVVYGEAHKLPLPERSIDVATLFDVIEHLVPGDDFLACQELRRVTRKHVLITANNRDSKLPDGTQLHINKRPYEEWDSLFREWFEGAKVAWLSGHHYVSEGWRIDL